MTVNVYEQYFAAESTANGVKRHGALCMLISDSENGYIRYETAVTFFPYNAPDDFAISYDAYFSEVIYEGKGRRSKKREKMFLESFRDKIDALAAKANGKVFWDTPLKEAREG